MKKSFLFFFALTFSLFCLFGCSGISANGPKSNEPPAMPEGEPTAVDEFHFRHSGMRSGDCYHYSVKKTTAGEEFHFETYARNTNFTVMLREPVLQEVAKIFHHYSVKKWAGFKGPNPPGLLDGTSFGISVKYADGTMVEARGSNNFPKNYRYVYHELDKIFMHLAREYNPKAPKVMPSSELKHVSVHFVRDGFHDNYYFSLSTGGPKDKYKARFDVQVKDTANKNYPQGKLNAFGYVYSGDVDLEPFRELLEKYNVASWNGWDKESKEKPLPERFSINCDFAGGEFISAEGTIHPPQYAEFRREMQELFLQYHTELKDRLESWRHNNN